MTEDGLEVDAGGEPDAPGPQLSTQSNAVPSGEDAPSNSPATTELIEGVAETSRDREPMPPERDDDRPTGGGQRRERGVGLGLFVGVAGLAAAILLLNGVASWPNVGISLALGAAAVAWSRHATKATVVCVAMSLLVAYIAYRTDDRPSPPPLTVNVRGQLAGQDTRLTDLVVHPGDHVEVTVDYENTTGHDLHEVMIENSTTPGLAIDPQSWRRRGSSDDDLVPIAAAADWVSLGTIHPGPGRVAYNLTIQTAAGCLEVARAVVTAADTQLQLGDLTLRMDRDDDRISDVKQCEPIVGPVQGNWGPDRELFDWIEVSGLGGPLNGPVFNSFLSVPSYGDERNFMVAARGDTYSAGIEFKDPLRGIVDARSVVVRMYVANDSVNAPPEGEIGVARNTIVRIQIPEGEVSAMDVVGYISADNATPHEVFDMVVLEDSTSNFSVTYRAGSAQLISPALPAPLQLPDEIVSGQGVVIGDDALDGDFRPGWEHYAYVVAVLDIHPA